VIGSFAGIRFETSDSRILNFLQLSREKSARFANHEVIGAKPKKEHLGPGLDSLDFTMALDAEHGVKPKVTIRMLDRVIDSGKNSPFILGGWNLGRFVIVSKSDTYDIITNRGGIVQAKVDVSLEEYR